MAPGRPPGRGARSGSPTAGEVVRLVLDAVNRGDAEGLVELMHPDVELFPILASLDGGYKGRAGVRRWLRSLELDWELYETRLEWVHDLGDSALGLGTWRARGRRSGVELDSQPGGWHARVSEGRVVSWRTFTNRAEALASVGPAGRSAVPARFRPDEQRRLKRSKETA